MTNKFDPENPSEKNLGEVASGLTALPAAAYTNAQYHEFELTQLYKNSWMAIGFASEFADKEQASPIDILGQSLLVTRDKDDQLHVFANVCRHRGHLLLNKPCIKKKLLTCPYHSWSYALDGQFVKAPFWDGTKNSKPNAEQKANMGLISIRFSVWYDIIFINLSGIAQPFEQFISGIQGRWGDQRPATLLRRFSEREYSVQGNWKLAAENFLDNYHLPWIHPEIGSSMEASLGLEVENIQLSPDIMGFTHPTAGSDKSKSEMPLPGWPGMDNANQMRQDLLFIFPNTCLVMEGNYLWSMLLFPRGVGGVEEKLALYVVDDGAMTGQYKLSRQQLANVIYRINDQDSEVIKNLQAGRQGDAASKGIFNDRHDQLAKWFHQRVANLVLS